MPPPVRSTMLLARACVETVVGLMADDARRRRMAACGRALVDGQGATAGGAGDLCSCHFARMECGVRERRRERLPRRDDQDGGMSRSSRGAFPNFPGRWLLVTDAASLSAGLIQALQPRYVFFPHWSWTVPDDVLAAAECVCFHMTDVPYGRGGSPLQNLVSRGHTETKLSALRMVPELDAGPVLYEARPVARRRRP